MCLTPLQVNLFLYVGYFLSASFFNLQDILLCKEDCHPHTSTYFSREGRNHLQRSAGMAQEHEEGLVACPVLLPLCQVLSVAALMSLQLSSSGQVNAISLSPVLLCKR